MKLRVIKSFRHGELNADNGDVITVGKNVAHGLLESGLATSLKAIEAPKRDKMMTRKRKLKVTVK